MGKEEKPSMERSRGETETGVIEKLRKKGSRGETEQGRIEGKKLSKDGLR